MYNTFFMRNGLQFIELNLLNILSLKGLELNREFSSTVVEVSLYNEIKRFLKTTIKRFN